MKVCWKKAAWVALVAAVVFGGVAAKLQARPATMGKFTLPFDAQWGMVSLPAGDYAFAVDHMTPNGTIFVYRGAEAVGIVRPQDLENGGDPSAAGQLLCMRHDGKYTVRALALPEVGTFYFALPTDLNTLVAQQPQLVETVSIQVSGE
jgi:hypothetical protein